MFFGVWVGTSRISYLDGNIFVLYILTDTQHVYVFLAADLNKLKIFFPVQFFTD